jgi:hypothetical protein
MKADEVYGKLESRLSALEKRSDMKAIKEPLLKLRWFKKRKRKEN